MRTATFTLGASIIALLAAPTDVIGQWEQFDGPENLQINDIESGDAYLYAGTDQGVYRSEDDGRTWASVSTGLPTDRFFSDLMAVGTDLFALVEQNNKWRVLRSTNDGKNWFDASEGLPNRFWSFAAIDDRLFLSGFDIRIDKDFDLGIDKDNVYRSIDYGETWQPIGNEKLFGTAYLAAQGNELFASEEQTVYRTSDFGENWIEVANETLVGEVWTEKNGGLVDYFEFTSIFAAGNKLIVSVIIDGIVERPLGGAESHEYHSYQAFLRSTDHGDNWTLVHLENEMRKPLDYTIRQALSIGETIFACNRYDVIRSTNEGNWWDTVSAGLPDGYSNNRGFIFLTDLAVIGDTLFVATWDGVYSSPDQGESWLKTSSGLPRNSYVESLAARGSKLYAALGAYGVYLSRDQAASWSYVGGGSGVIDITRITTTGKNLFAVSAQGSYESTNNGESWTPLRPPSTDATISSNDMYLFKVTRDVFYRAKNDDRSWEVVADNMYGNGTVSFLVGNSVLFYLDFISGIHRSTDNGEDWTSLGPGKSPYHQLSRPNLNTVLFLSTPSGIFRSTDNGDNWTAVNRGLPDPPFSDLESVDRYQFVNTSNGVFVFNNADEVWVPVQVGLPLDSLVDLDASKTDIFAHTRDAGTWRLRMSQLQGAKD